MSKYIEPKEQARVIYNSFYSMETHQNSVRVRDLVAKNSSIIHIDGLIAQFEQLFYDFGLGYLGKSEARNDIAKYGRWQQLQKVKEEIEKL